MAKQYIGDGTDMPPVPTRIHTTAWNEIQVPIRVQV